MKCSTGSCQGEVLLMLCFEETSEPKIRSCFLCLLIWKKPLIGCQEKLFNLL